MRIFSYIALIGLAALIGCQQTLFPSTLPRSQFETYDKSRGTWVPKEKEGYKGRKEVPLRERLKPHQP